jgi:hypothetical protein
MQQSSLCTDDFQLPHALILNDVAILLSQLSDELPGLCLGFTEVCCLRTRIIRDRGIMAHKVKIVPGWHGFGPFGLREGRAILLGKLSTQRESRNGRCGCDCQQTGVDGVEFTPPRVEDPLKQGSAYKSR